jgi:transposase-like protein
VERSGDRLETVMSAEAITPRNLAHMTPTNCPRCSGEAPLVRRGPDAFKRDGKTEIWVFRCKECGYQFGRTVER